MLKFVLHYKIPKDILLMQNDKTNKLKVFDKYSTSMLVNFFNIQSVCVGAHVTWNTCEGRSENNLQS